jgi:hypothetical protein
MAKLTEDQIEAMGCKIGKLHEFYEVGRVLKPFDGFGYSVIYKVDEDEVHVVTDFGNILKFSVKELLSKRIVPIDLQFHKYDDNVEPIYFAPIEIESVEKRIERQLENLNEIKSQLAEGL